MTLLDTEDFLSQTGKVTLGLARLLLNCNKGEKLPRMIDIARTLKSGNGTIQEAFNNLVRLRAIAVESRGSQGSHLVEVDYTLLWRYAGNEWIIGSMPLPYTHRYEGLATALYAQLEQSGVPFNMTYQRGALSRGEMVRQKHYHYAVMSELAAEAFSKDHPEVSIVVTLPTQSYVAEHVLISRVPREQIRRVGVDFSSLDEVILTQEEAGIQHNWQTISVTRAQVLDLLLEDEFDAIIWNRDGVLSAPRDVLVLPLQGDERKRESATRATIVARRDAPVCNVLLSLFQQQTITAVQQEVFHKQRFPRY
ncbi:MAG TPA: GntR family transcriptional regulator YhfZ [Ktedonobacteraceae bacterium]|jgi:hypothetical protein|nr:GntR family transcriptional regulator YhfZ [Ktedonobacteraceae bacterium]